MRIDTLSETLCTTYRDTEMSGDPEQVKECRRIFVGIEISATAWKCGAA